MAFKFEEAGEGATARDVARYARSGGRRVSVVIPTCGRPELLRRCLEAVEKQRIDPADVEVIVVDDRPGGSDTTVDVVARYARRQPSDGMAFRCLRNAGAHGPAAARNLGWKAAVADVIAFTDDDTRPSPFWLCAGLAALASGNDAVTGRIVVPLPTRPTDYERDASGLAHAQFATANCFCRKAVLGRVGGFDERFRLAWREDSDLQFRILESGGRIGRAEDAVVVHPVRPAPWGLSLRQQRKVMYDALLFRNHPALYRLCIRSHPRWDYYAAAGALAAALVLGFTGHAPAALALAGTWAAVTLAFCSSRLSGTSHRWQHVLEMLVTSALIPPLAVFWRAVGALRFRVVFL